MIEKIFITKMYSKIKNSGSKKSENSENFSRNLFKKINAISKMASVDSRNEDKTALVVETKDTESEEAEPTNPDESLKSAVNNEPNNETSLLTSDETCNEGKSRLDNLKAIRIIQ